MGTKEPYTGTGNRDERRDPTGNDPKSKLARIAAKARKSPTEQFNNLVHPVCRELVEEKLQKISSSSAPGVDGMTKEQARKGLDWILPPLLDAIHQGSYEPPPVRRVYIPKSDGRQRPIGVPTIVDRAIQAVVAEILNGIYEQDFLSCSFGFRPGLSCHHALATVHERVANQGMIFALEVDIRDFFGSINHDWMMQFLRHRISDPRMLKLLESWLKAGVMEEGQWQEVERGTPQGGSISPIFANVYLHYILDLWFEHKVKGRTRRAVSLVRYADDFVILCADPQDREDIQALLRVRLAQFGLVIAENKTHKTDLNLQKKRGGAERRHLGFLGFTVYRKKTRAREGKGQGVTTVFQTEMSRLQRAKASLKDKLHRLMHQDLKTQAGVINATLIGHYNYYGMAGNSRSIHKFREFAKRQWRRCLSRRSQRGSVPWKQMNEWLDKHPLTAPKVKVKYGQLTTYARL